MAFTTVPDKASGDIVTETNWDTHLKDNINWLHAPPMCMVRSGTAWSVAGSVVFTFGTAGEQFDTDSMFGTANPTRVTVQTAGVYLVTANSGQASTSVSRYRIEVAVNGTPIAQQATHADAQTSSGAGESLAIPWSASSADYFEASAIGTATLNAPALSVTWIGAAT